MNNFAIVLNGVFGNSIVVWPLNEYNNRFGKGNIL